MPEGVRIIMIGTDASGRAQGGNLQIEGLSEELLVATINAIIPGLPQDVPRSVAAVCGRSPKLAVVIAEQIRADPTLVPTRFVADSRVRTVLDRYLKLDPQSPSWSQAWPSLSASDGHGTLSASPSNCLVPST
jgi:hypothetical protein